MSLLALLGLLSALQSPPLRSKILVLGNARRDKLNNIYNYANIIWVQDQTFTGRGLVLELIIEIEDKVT